MQQSHPILKDVDVNCNLRTTYPQDKCFFDRKYRDLDFTDWERDLVKLKIKYKGLIVLDFNSIICPETVCYSYLNKVPFYPDDQHLTYTGSAEIGVEYLKRYGNPLKTNAQ
ncbi:SGNH hydrolase domain-containing protein [Acinetobacter towneri]|uniref:SGNH hydrolase domain-containing protein n=1 Tax=Acinetobacter towneri TaxID=202956 RepID=UPI001B843708|nr:hypothetical protein DSM16313_26280 [Acinetobacter seohaensis]